MSSRYIRDTVIFGKVETTVGIDAVPTGALNAQLISNVRMTPLNAQFVPRDVLRNYFGASEELIASYNKLITFDVEAVGSGTAGTAPAWSPIIRCCGMAESIVATERVKYKPVTNGQESSTFYAYDSGVLHKYLATRGGFTIGMGINNIPKLSFSLIAIDGGDTAALPSGVSFTGFKVPEVVRSQASGTIILGGAMSASSVPAITGGTAYPSQGLELDMGIKAEFIQMLGADSVEITDRKSKGKIKLDLTAAQEIAFYASIKAGTLQSLAMLHGTVVGNRFGVFAPNAQIIMPSKEDLQGKRLMGYDVNLLPSATGNDEVEIHTSW